MVWASAFWFFALLFWSPILRGWYRCNLFWLFTAVDWLCNLWLFVVSRFAATLAIIPFAVIACALFLVAIAAS